MGRLETIRLPKIKPIDNQYRLFKCTKCILPMAHAQLISCVNCQEMRFGEMPRPIKLYGTVRCENALVDFAITNRRRKCELNRNGQKRARGGQVENDPWGICCSLSRFVDQMQIWDVHVVIINNIKKMLLQCLKYVATILVAIPQKRHNIQRSQQIPRPPCDSLDMVRDALRLWMMLAVHRSLGQVSLQVGKPY